MEPSNTVSTGSLLAVLGRWNRWGGAELASGFARGIVERLRPFLETADLVALLGPRRAGKTTVLYQVMGQLRALGVPDKAMLHLNFEEPAFGPDLGPELLERLYRAYRAEVWPTGRAYLFLDEVQHVAGWERWVRARRDTENAKIFVTGSSTHLLSRELGTLLTGRHVSFQVMPLSFAEVLRFRAIEPPEEPRLAGEPAEIAHALRSYLRWGGFPEVVLAETDVRREVLLRQYFDDVLFKDVALRHEIRDVATLRNIAVHLLGQTASLVTFKRVAGVFGVSLDLARAYCGHLEEAFLLSFLPFQTLKTAERLRRPQKVHALDLGLRNAVTLGLSPDWGHLAETAVANHLATGAGGGLSYWQGNSEVDLVLRRGNEVEHLVQVAFGDLERRELRERELSGLAEAGERFPHASRTLVVERWPAALPEPAGTAVVPLWRFLLEDQGD